VLSGSAVGAFVARARAETPPDGDLAYLRLLLAAELLAADFQARARASGKLRRSSPVVIRKMAADEKAHYARLAHLLTAAGQTPATAADIDFSYPKGTFRSEASIIELGAEIERIVLGAYLGSVENVQTDAVRLPIGQIAANEAQHVGALAALSGRPLIGPALARALEIDAASAALDRFEG
jgi:rubrerythrin